MKQLNQSKLRLKPLAERISKSDLSVIVDPESEPQNLSEEETKTLEQIANSMKLSRDSSSPIVFSFGAHLIKNGMSRVLIELMRGGYVQHLLSNQAVTIHDWELAFQGKTEEDVADYLEQGQFGLWDETGRNLAKAVAYGAEHGLGFGESVGREIETNNYPHKNISVLAEAYRRNIPFSIGITLGQNITDINPDFDWENVAKTGKVDFDRLTETVFNLKGGIYFSIGSAVLSPQIFEKVLSVARNVGLQDGTTVEDYDIVVNDIQPGNWNWSRGEPPKDNPAYYLRFMKSFSRAPNTRLQYLEMDNRKFLHNLYHLLKHQHQ